MSQDLKEPLTPKQHKAIYALIEQPTLEAAAEAAEVSTATLKRWRKQPEFVGEYRRQRARVLEDAYSRLTNASAQAVAALVRHLNSGVPTIEVRAAIAILEKAQRGVETFDIIERLEELEEALERRKERKWG